MITQCMGGWCHKRNQCIHFSAPDNGDDPEERLCAAGMDEPVRTGDSLASVERVVCIRCGQDGHISDHCPWPNGTSATNWS